MTDDDLHDRLTEALATVAGAVLVERSLQGTLEVLLRLATRLLPRCSAGSVALLVEGKVTSAAASRSLAFEADLLQYEAGEGPCISALGGQIVRAAFVPTDERFPHFAIGAADRRILSVLSLPLTSGGDVVGTMNLYARQADAFDEADELTAQVLAAEAAVAVRRSSLYGEAEAVRRELQLELDAAAELDAATQALVSLHQCSRDQAEALLQRAADASGDRVLDAARRVLDAIEQDPGDGP